MASTSGCATTRSASAAARSPAAAHAAATAGERPASREVLLGGVAVELVHLAAEPLPEVPAPAIAAADGAAAVSVGDWPVPLGIVLVVDRQTELEQLLTVLRSLGPEVVVIDEADADLGTREGDGDSGTSSRVLGLIAGQSGLRRIDRFEIDDLPAKVAGQVPDDGEAGFDPETVLPAKDVRKNDPFILYGIAAAREAGVRIYFGSLDYESAGAYFSFLAKAVARGHRFGCTLPSRWMRSLDDVERVVDLGLDVRVVKGQWADPVAPRLDCRKNFLEIISRLVGRGILVGVATHDVSVARKALRTLFDTSTTFGMEKFFSLPPNCMNLAKRFECNYRIHVAYGGDGIPYNTRFAFRRPQLFVWVARDILGNRRQPWTGEPGDPTTSSR